MGASMRKAVFTEFVVEGLKKWRGRARKNIALRNTNWQAGRPSLDANSLETYSVDTSPSFGTLDHASFSVDHADSVAVEITDEDNLRPKHESKDHASQKISSFDGFHLTNRD